jgi:hypothetical protein
MRYQFHEQRDTIKKNPKHVLPADINAPVVAFLERIGCSVGAEELKKLQHDIAYGGIDLVHDDHLNARVSLSTELGMCDGWKQYEIIKAGKWSIIKYKTVKNSNLDKRKPKELVK